VSSKDLCSPDRAQDAPIWTLFPNNVSLCLSLSPPPRLPPPSLPLSLVPLEEEEEEEEEEGEEEEEIPAPPCRRPFICIE
jgi:hypothetical protein